MRAPEKATSVLVVTGGLLNEKETSVWRALRKQRLQWRAAKSAWLDLKIKMVMAESVTLGQVHRLVAGGNTKQAVKNYFKQQENLGTPELTEVVLATLLRAEGLPYETASVDDLFAASAATRAKVDACAAVFLSATLLRDLSEVEPLVKLVKRPWNRVMIGGALAGLLADEWPGMPEVDVLAVGYGEYLVPILARYIKSGFTDLNPALPARVALRRFTKVLYSGVPATKSLDDLVTPDWAASARDYGLRFPMIYYESVRGCPYRCNFCNYPYLFDDTKFRYKSARKIADDWQRYKDELGVEYISCLDSLFTMPRRRLAELCEELVRRKLDIKWICYARADDLARRDIALMMKEAGAHQVQIGIESGDQDILDNMDKQCTVEANQQALVNCRAVGLTSVVSLIVGFPGECAATIERTYRFLEQSQPDFYFLATFSTRVAGVPILNQENRERFALESDANPHTVAPYWSHRTMNSMEVGNQVRALHQRLMANRVSLNAPMFYGGLLRYAPSQRDDLLDFQQAAVSRYPLVRRLFDASNAWLDRKLAADFARWHEKVAATPKPAYSNHQHSAT